MQRDSDELNPRELYDITREHESGSGIHTRNRVTYLIDFLNKPIVPKNIMESRLKNLMI